MQQNKGNGNFLFNITKSYTQTPYIIPTNIRQYSGSPLSFYYEWTKHIVRIHRETPWFPKLTIYGTFKRPAYPSPSPSSSGWPEARSFARRSIGVWRYGNFMLGCWSVGRYHNSQGWPFAVRSSKPASPSTSPNGPNKPEALQYVQTRHTPPSASPSSSNQPEVAYQHRFPSAHKIAKVQSRQEFT